MASDPTGVRKETDKVTGAGIWTPGFVYGSESKSTREAFEQVKNAIEKCRRFSKSTDGAGDETVIVPSQFTAQENDGGFYYNIIKKSFSECGFGTSDEITCKYVLRIHPDLGNEIQVFGYDNEAQTRRNITDPYKAIVDDDGVTVTHLEVSSKPKT